MSKNSEDVVVILAAAGSATRFRNSSSDAVQLGKTFVAIDDIPVWQYSVRQFRRISCVGQILMTVAADIVDDIRAEFGEYLHNENVALVLGGTQRWSSVANGLAYVASSYAGDASQLFVAVHDAARPCVSLSSIETVIAKAKATGAAILGQSIWGTAKRTDQNGKIIETISRENLFQASTPQVARLDWLRHAYSNENIQHASQSGLITDDAQLLSFAGYPVHLCSDQPSNIKITTYEDLSLAKFFLRDK